MTPPREPEPVVTATIRERLAALGEDRRGLQLAEGRLFAEIAAATAEARNLGVSMREIAELLGLPSRQALYRVLEAA